MVTKHDDGPRHGVADFHGVPHVFRSVYLDTQAWNESEDRFELSPIPPDAFGLVLESAAISARFDSARRAGKVAPPSMDAPRALPGPDYVRHIEIAPQLEHALAIDPARSFLMRGAFRVRKHESGLAGDAFTFQVRWQSVDDQTMNASPLERRIFDWRRWYGRTVSFIVMEFVVVVLLIVVAMTATLPRWLQRAWWIILPLAVLLTLPLWARASRAAVDRHGMRCMRCHKSLIGTDQGEAFLRTGACPHCSAIHD